MNINVGNSFLRIKLLTPANFGSAGGRATMDSPTQVDVYTHLPYIPDSSLKGVLKCAFEFTNSKKLDEIFGTPDINSEQDKILSSTHSSSGKLVVGNGELLAFPYLSENGERIWIFPMDNITKFIYLEKLNNIHYNFDQLLKRFYMRDNFILLITSNSNSTINIDFDFTLLNCDDIGTELKALCKCLKNWCENDIPNTDPWLIANRKAAERFWHRSLEDRTLTALNKQKSALGQSLRRIELVPEGSVFLSLVTWLDSTSLTFQFDSIQVGAWESLGLGFCKISNILNHSSTPNNQRCASSNIVQNISLNNHQLMIGCHKKILQLANDNSASDYRAKIWPILNNFGIRVHLEGFEAALAFEFAKAKLNSNSTPTAEIKAHRWFLVNILNIKSSELKDCWRHWFSDSINTLQKQQILLTWQWLKRYSEIILK